MKRAMMLFLAAGLLLSMTSGARAADVNAAYGTANVAMSKG